MVILANYKSIKTVSGIKIFRYDTEFRSDNGPGNVIGLIYMLNPGSARPESDELFEKLSTEEYETERPVVTKSDNTMKKVMKLIKQAYAENNIKLPEQYTFHIENLFNIRSKSSDEAKKLAKNLSDTCELMYKARKLQDEYQFVWLAWGKTNIQASRQREILNKYKNAIMVHKLNQKGILKNVEYPVHPLYVNSEYFLEAAEGKIG
ncbi:MULTISPECIES: DUF1643 domain-containing protein [Clostridium]|uniref:DUF1643 domain-containing protein n=1 Tax=Clostridium TaxID=1485 RepID=UPI0008250DA0|nr:MULTISPECIES: DUF1643 domain-containing protein [Clostridium]PJI07212.1 DUF1643 domain-containing protein [Clostridium sp. CT7]